MMTIKTDEIIKEDEAHPTIIWEPEFIQKQSTGDISSASEGGGSGGGVAEKGERTGKVFIYDQKGNAFHLCAVVRKYTGAKLEFVLLNRKRTGLIKISTEDLWCALGLLRSLQFDVEQYNSIVRQNLQQQEGNPGETNKQHNNNNPAEFKYRCFRLTQQAAAMGVRLPPTPESIITVEGLDSLIEYVEKEFQDIREAAKANLQSGLVDFESLSEYFLPGKYLVDHGVGTGMAVGTMMRCRACYYSKSKSMFGINTTFHVAMEVVVSTGQSQYAVVESQFTQSQFNGTRSIHHAMDLFTEPTAQQMESLKARGVKYQQICNDIGGKMVHYDAGTFVPTSKGSLKGGSSRVGSYGHASRSGGRMMVDTQAAWDRGVHGASNAGVASDTVIACLKLAAEQRRAQDHKKQHSSSDEYNTSSAVSVDYHNELLLVSSPLPDSLVCLTWPVVPGFSLLSRTWGVAMVHGTSAVVFNERAFDELVMSFKRKKLIQALVKSHESRKSADVIAGKGEGSIFLLHGPPGVGKTLTAEAISELLHKPLYVVSMGDLGTSPETLEERLQDILDLCVPWKALVLIDEAEMLLERRTKNDIIRNAMVCVMLRLLEYYSGILFLTTNRVESLDPAFQSRVTCALRYDPLSFESRKEIWIGALKRLNVDFSAIEIDELAKVDINGRQIKNALQLAVALADDENVPMSQEHLDTTLEVTTSFLTDVNGIE